MIKRNYLYLLVFLGLLIIIVVAALYGKYGPSKGAPGNVGYGVAIVASLPALIFLSPGLYKSTNKPTVFPETPVKREYPAAKAGAPRRKIFRFEGAVEQAREMGVIIPKDDVSFAKYGKVEERKFDGQPFLEIPVRGDGNCFYHALSISLANMPGYEGELNYVKLRDIAVNVMEANKDELEIYYAAGVGLERQNAKFTLDQYIADQRRNGVMAENMAILSIANHLNVRIVVDDFNRERGEARYEIGPEKSKNVVYVRNVDNGHFTSLIPAQLVQNNS